MLLVAVVVLVGVSLLLGLGEAVDEVVGALVGDVAQQAVDKVAVAVKLVLDGITVIKGGRLYFKLAFSCLQFRLGEKRAKFLLKWLKYFFSGKKRRRKNGWKTF